MGVGISAMACNASGFNEILNTKNGWLLPIDLNILETAGTIENITENKHLINKKNMKHALYGKKKTISQ